MTMTLTHEAPVKQATAILESAVAALVQGPNDPIRLERADQLPNPTRTACSIVNAAIEACNGTRPLHQLLGWVSPDVYEALSARAQVLAQRQQPGSAHRAPDRHTALGRTTNRIIRARVVRISHLAAEATVIVDDGNRVRAAALRLEENRGRWQVTVLEIG
ncbi:Rv3235 family protein [Jonesiaceae bacterium BS-20]|uniref:Rv3235 family protein n=1 Tax=Jonesiaceae bacterium BS-20 TaxID=3120821 RepID=A0AAU7DXM8_9MICO